MLGLGLLCGVAGLVGSCALAAAADRGDNVTVGRAAGEPGVNIGRRGVDRRRGCRGIRATAGPAVYAVLRDARGLGLSPVEVDTPRLGRLRREARRR